MTLTTEGDRPPVTPDRSYGPTEIRVPIHSHTWWRLAGVAEDAGITVGDLLTEITLDGRALAAAERRAARDRAASARALAQIAAKYHDSSVDDEDFLAWIESVLPTNPDKETR